jgi:UDP-N-acetylglucosamine 2-epimerase (non-hydrolysing)
MLIHLVCGARPNFMKVAPLYHALTSEHWALPLIVHTGQHYDVNMSASFFKDLGLPQPHIYLGVGSGSHAEQTAKVMVAYEKVVRDQVPDLIVVVGDVNSTMAATLVAAKLSIRVAHLEAGLRSFDRTMPEEINRLVTDALADCLWVPSRDAIDNLIAEGVPSSKIEFVGNIMIDSLEMLRKQIETLTVWRDYGLTSREYGIVTLHRPSNVDQVMGLRRICDVLEAVSETVPLIFPMHPRTKAQINQDQLLARTQRSGRLIICEPLNYISFMNLVMNSRLVITDSGGIQEETSYLGIPCLTIRGNTERPVTISQGTNQLCDVNGLQEKVAGVLRDDSLRIPTIELWDGRTAQRIVSLLRAQAGQLDADRTSPDRVHIGADVRAAGSV